MSNAVKKASWTLWLMLAVAAPAYANNPPAPDGMLSVILLFPMAILGFRISGAALNEKEHKWRVLRWIFLTLTVLVSAAGTGIGAAALLILLGYGILRGAQMMKRGQGARRFALGIAMILFTLFAVANYMASLNNYRTEGWYTARGASGLRAIVAAENAFHERKMLDSNKSGVPEYGSLQQLVQAELIEREFISPAPHHHYHYTLVLSGDPARDEKEFFVYASPGYYDTSRRTISLVDAFRRHGSRTTLAADESGTLRRADVGSARPVTRQEVQSWEKLEY